MTKYLKFIVFITFMIGSTEASYADFGFIQDKDGYVNVRENSSLSSKVTTKLNNNEIVSCVMDEETNNFCLVNASNGVTGFVYKNRINSFGGYTSIKLSQYSREKAVYSDKNIIVEVYAKKAILILNFIKLLKVNISILMIKSSLVQMVAYLTIIFYNLIKLLLKKKITE